ncbi:MAG: alpha/beta fold hydrolase [Spirochaetales bacterium]|nr:alpha/beta fold hydrolase [Spirochaetales bacterium]
MKGEEIRFKSTDGHEGAALRWLPEGEIRAALIINHGMAEHIGRYEDFALFLNRAGIAVWGEDHRGHGRTAGEKDNLGYFHIDNGWERVLSDISSLKSLVQETHPGTPLFMLGHSMGSFLTRDFLCDEGDDFAGAIISGTGYTPAYLARMMRFIARREVRRHGDRHRSSLLDTLSFGSFNRNFRPNRTSYDWLSRDEEQVDLYGQDDYCGFISTSSFFEDLSDGLLRIIDPGRIDQTSKKLPLFFYSGDEDPVGGKKGTGVKRVYQLYKKAGLINLSLQFNEGGRHESLNETNRQDVYQMFLDFIEVNLG